MLILASASPRRKELLAMITPQFQVIESQTEEYPHVGETVSDRVKRLAKQKADAVFAHYPQDIVLGADTLVTVNNTEILGKPKNTEDAFNMLRCLAGKTHTVYTGVAIVSTMEEHCWVSGATVTFAELSDKEIQEYIATGEPMDKAGAYAVQGIGSRFITQICGDYHAVVGLPVQTTYQKLRRLL